VGGFDTGTGNLCVNVYAFDPQEAMISCCSCLVSPDGLNSLSARNDIINNTLTPAVPSSIVIKLVASLPPSTGLCNAGSSAAVSEGSLAPGIRAGATTLEPGPQSTHVVVSHAFQAAGLSAFRAGPAHHLLRLRAVDRQRIWNLQLLPDGCVGRSQAVKNKTQHVCTGKRDEGKIFICGAANELYFDYYLPSSK
jgi:hypothetical protein